MSLKKCIDNSVEAGLLTLEEGQALKERYDTLAKQVFARGSAKEQLAAEIKAEADERKRIALLTETVRQRLERSMMNHFNAKGLHDPMEAQLWILEQGENQGYFSSVIEEYNGLMGIYHGKMRDLIHEFRGKAKISGDWVRRFGDTKKLMEDVARERFGESTGNEVAKRFADVFGEVAEELRVLRNEAGGATGKLDSWALPTHWNQESILNVREQEFVDDFIKEIDLDKMRHPLTSGPMSREEVIESLKFIHLDRSTDGWAKREPTGQMEGKGALFKQRSDHRFLHFRDADGWMRLQKKYGDPDPWSAMTGHISSMVRDIAMMRALGPNPIAMRQYIKQFIEDYSRNIKPNNKLREGQLAKIKSLIKDLPKTLEEKRYNLSVARIDLDDLQRQMKNAKLTNNNKRSELRNGIAAKRFEVENLSKDILEELKNTPWPALNRDGTPFEPRLKTIEEADRLLNDVRQEMPEEFDRPEQRAAEYAATADKVFASIQGSYGMPEPGAFATLFSNSMQAVRNMQVATKLGGAGVSAITDIGLQRGARVLAGMPTNGVIRAYLKQFTPGMQQKAARQSLIVDSALHVYDRKTRYGAATGFSGVSGFVADRVLVAGGLTPMTQTAKHAVGLELLGYTADMIARSWGELPAKFRKAMEYSGLTETHWQSMQLAGVNKEGFLNPGDVYAIDKDAGIKFNGHVHKIMRAAVSEPTHRQRVALYGETKKGSVYGEFLRSFFQFKGFGVSVLFLYAGSMRRAYKRGDTETLAQMAVSSAIYMTVLGAAAIQLKEMAAGRDPRDMENPKFWGGAILQGGGLGIYGDFIFADHNRFGGSALGTAMGPTGALVEETLKFTVGNAQQALEGKDTGALREGVRLIGRNIVPGQNLIYLRLVYERHLLDELAKLDPKSYRAFRRSERKRLKDFGQEYWFAPGADGAERGPDLGAALPSFR